MKNVAHTRKSPHDPNRWLNRTAVFIALLYTLVFAFRIVRTYWTRRSSGLDIDWTVPDNPQSMIALCSIAGALALYFLHQTGRLIAAVLFVSEILFFVRWAILTENIRSNMGVTRIPSTNVISSWWIGAGPLDVVAFLSSIVLFVWCLYRWRANRQSASVDKQQLHIARTA